MKPYGHIFYSDEYPGSLLFRLEEPALPVEEFLNQIARFRAAFPKATWLGQRRIGAWILPAYCVGEVQVFCIGLFGPGGCKIDTFQLSFLDES